MTMVLMENHGGVGVKRPKLEQTCPSMALATVLARWFGPLGIRKAILQAWPDLTEDEARACVEGTASKTTIKRLLHRDRGGWRLALEMLPYVIGERLEDHLAQERERHEELAHRSASLAAELRSLGPRVSGAADRNDFEGGQPAVSDHRRATAGRGPLADAGHVQRLTARASAHTSTTETDRRA